MPELRWIESAASGRARRRAARDGVAEVEPLASVCDQEDGSASAASRDVGDEGFGRLGIEGGRGLVVEEHRRLGEERSGDDQPLPLPARQL